MEHRLPEIVSVPGPLPVATVRPALNQLAVLPGEPILAPDLARVCVRVEDAALELHEHVISIHQRNLVMDHEVTARSSLVRYQGIIYEVGQDFIQILPGIGDAAGMGRVLPPFGPG